MQNAILVLTLFNGLGFLLHGVSCLCSESMHQEFVRYGLSRQRKLVGVLQLVGAVGLLWGLVYLPLGIVSAFGLALLMTFGVWVRKRTGDGVVQMMPAALYALANAILASLLLGQALA